MMNESGPSFESEPLHKFDVIEIPVDGETVFTVQTENGDVNRVIVRLLPWDMVQHVWSGGSEERIEDARQNANMLKEKLAAAETQELIENYIFEARQLNRVQSHAYHKCLVESKDGVGKINELRLKQRGEEALFIRNYRQQLGVLLGVDIVKDKELEAAKATYRFHVVEVPYKSINERVFVVQTDDGDINRQIVGHIIPENLAANIWNEFDGSKGSIEEARTNAHILKKKLMSPQVQGLIGDYLRKKEELRARQRREKAMAGEGAMVIDNNRLKEGNDFVREYRKKMDALLGI